MANKPMIKPSHRGRFTKWAKGQGMSTEQATSKVLANPKAYSANKVKQANFSRNFGGN